MKCKICEKKTEFLESHHIIPKSRGGTDDKSNLIELCSKCHGLAHNVSFANEQINEVACHARGARYIYGDSIKTFVDMGGQDCKVIKCDGGAKVITFMMNDKCATGAGRGVEVFADMVSVPLQDIGTLSLDVDEEPEQRHHCTQCHYAQEPSRNEGRRQSFRVGPGAQGQQQTDPGVGERDTDHCRRQDLREHSQFPLRVFNILVRMPTSRRKSRTRAINMICITHLT